jgi:hypothetical protein
MASACLVIRRRIADIHARIPRVFQGGSMLFGRRISAAAVAVGVAISGQVHAAGSICPIGNGLSARQVRLLQTELMVAALTCRSNAKLDLEGKYGSFARRFSPELKRHADALREEFKGNATRMDKYVTGIANASSDVSLANPTYCDQVVALFDAVLAVKPGTLHAFAAERAPSFAAAQAAGVAGCTGEPTKPKAKPREATAKKQ